MSFSVNYSRYLVCNLTRLTDTGSVNYSSIFYGLSQINGCRSLSVNYLLPCQSLNQINGYRSPSVYFSPHLIFTDTRLTEVGHFPLINLRILSVRHQVNGYRCLSVNFSPYHICSDTRLKDTGTINYPRYLLCPRCPSPRQCFPLIIGLAVLQPGQGLSENTDRS